MDLLSDPRAYQASQAARRATTATSILDVAAWVGMFASVLFWNNFFWVLIAPAGIVEMALSLAFAAAYAVVLPMLISLLAPSTPAGMALAETRWKTIGHTIAVCAALFMAAHAFLVLWAWWAARPVVAQTGQELYLAIGTVIIFVVVPALSWVQIAPDRWVAEVVQAQQVRRLKAAQQANIMAAQIQYARAMAILRRGLANATAAEQQEVAGTIIAMQRAQNEAIGQVADQMRILTGIDTGASLIDDPVLEQQYQQLTSAMTGLTIRLPAIPAPAEDEYVELPPRQPAVSATFRRPPPAAEPWDGAELPPSPPAHQDARPAPSPPRRQPAAEIAAAEGGGTSAATRGDSRRLAAEFRAVAAAFPAPAIFGVRQVADTIGKSERTARDYLAVWREWGWVERGEAPNSYYITEGP